MEDDNKEIDIGEIRRLLCSIRTSGTKNIEPVKTLIGLLLEKDTEEVYLTKEECLLFYDAILSYYIDDEKDLKMMLAVSGRLDGYRSISTATKRRDKYHGVSEQTAKYSDVLGAFRKREDGLLRSVAEKLYEDWKTNKIPEPIKERLSKSCQNNAEDNNDEPKVEKDEHKKYNYTTPNVNIDNSQRSNTFFQIINYIFDVETTHEESVTQIVQNNHFKDKTPNEGKLRKRHVLIVFLFALTIVSMYFINNYFMKESSTSVKELFVSTDEIVLEPGEYYYFGTAVGIIPKEAVNAPLNYVSSDTSVVTVSKDGMVLAQGDWKGKEPRMAKVTVQAESGATAHKIITVQKTTDDDILITADVDDFKPTYTLNVTVRNVTAGDKKWFDNRDVNIGDELEYQIVYRNTSNQIQYNVMIRDGLPANLEYIPGTTRLWNASLDGYTEDDDQITKTGINIGNYGPNANAYVRFRVKVVDQSLSCGSTTLVNWAKGTANEMVLQDFANVTLNKEIFSE